MSSPAVFHQPGLDRGPALARVVAGADTWRRPVVGPAGADGSYKEWMHFCVRLPGDRPRFLLINLNVSTAAGPSGFVRVPRLLAVACLDRWSGTIQSFADDEVRGQAGGLDLRLGSNELSWRDGRYRLVVGTEALACDLRLRPLGLPSVTSSISFGAERVIHWVVIPRLEASGWVALSGQRLAIRDALAYHDHNWGNFRWGGDLSWEWGFVHPDDPRCPWSTVFVRVSDSRRHRTLSAGALVWNADQLVYAFQNREVDLKFVGDHASAQVFTLPPLAGFLAPGTAAGIPRRATIEARGAQGERLQIAYEPDERARIALPSEVDPFRLALLNETSGAAQVRGSGPAGSFAFDGAAVMEFVRG